MECRYTVNRKPYSGAQLDSMCSASFNCRSNSSNLNFFCNLMDSNAVFNSSSHKEQGFLSFRKEVLEKAQTAFLFRRV